MEEKGRKKYTRFHGTFCLPCSMNEKIGEEEEEEKEKSRKRHTNGGQTLQSVGRSQVDKAGRKESGNVHRGTLLHQRAEPVTIKQ